MPCLRHVSPTFAPASTSLRIRTIYSSLNFDFFMQSSSGGLYFRLARINEDASAAARRNRPFAGVADLCTRAALDARESSLLAEAGALPPRVARCSSPSKTRVGSLTY